MTYAALFLMMTWADAELAFRGRGPPPVPSRMSLVLVVWPCVLSGHENAPMKVAVPARNARRLQSGMNRPEWLVTRTVLQCAAWRWANARGALFPDGETESDSLLHQQRLPVHEEKCPRDEHGDRAGEQALPSNRTVQQVAQVRGGVAAGQDHRCVADEFSRQERRNEMHHRHLGHSRGGEQGRGGQWRQG